ncbi:MAG TPA: DUF4126 domain-containing protein [Ktedonobacterales bacterium]|nr:DUF4126 domain-containing protein [Ktedonobacterales bacterium]
MPDVSGDSVTVQAIGLLFTALGLSSVSGLRAYLPLLALAVGSNLKGSDGKPVVALSPEFHVLGSWPVIALLVLLVIGEFFVDKVPVIDHISDAVHTVIRPVSGAIIMAAVSNPISDRSPWAAAVLGAVLALTVHSAKAATRPAVTATTAGIGNPIVSTGEDVIAVVFTLLALLAPFVAVVLGLILLVAVLYLIRSGWRRLRGGGSARAAAVASSASSDSGTYEGPPL